jgi:hypothetical protein
MCTVLITAMAIMVVVVLPLIVTVTASLLGRLVGLARQDTHRGRETGYEDRSAG